MLHSRYAQVGEHPARTPARGLMKGRENSVARTRPQTFTVNSKGQVSGMRHPPKTPLQQHSLKSEHLFTDTKPTTILNTAPRPLGDKTPFTNRAAHVSPLLRPSKLALGEASASRPSLTNSSSTRKHPRVRRSLTVTPANNGGNPWDVSDGNISVGAQESSANGSMVIEEEDYDEIEYMPPKLEVPYTPPFDFELPNYKEVGEKLARLATSYPLDDYVPPPEPVVDLASTGYDPTWKNVKLELVELEDDSPFVDIPEPLAQQKRAPAGTAARGRPAAGIPVAATKTTNRSRPPTTASTSNAHSSSSQSSTHGNTNAARTAPAASGRPKAAQSAHLRTVSVASASRSTGATGTRPPASTKLALAPAPARMAARAPPPAPRAPTHARSMSNVRPAPKPAMMHARSTSLATRAPMLGGVSHARSRSVAAGLDKGPGKESGGLVLPLDDGVLDDDFRFDV